MKTFFRITLIVLTLIITVSFGFTTAKGIVDDMPRTFIAKDDETHIAIAPYDLYTSFEDIIDDLEYYIMVNDAGTTSVKLYDKNKVLTQKMHNDGGTLHIYRQNGFYYIIMTKK